GVATHGERCVVFEHDDCAIGQRIECSAVAPFRSPVEPLSLQHNVHLTGARRGAESMRARPSSRKRGCVGAATFEAGAMAGGQRGRLVEEEQLSVALAPDLPVPVLEREPAAYPCARGPTPARQRAVVSMEAAAAVAKEQTARLNGAKFAERIDAVLQRHRSTHAGTGGSNHGTDSD